MASNTEVAAPSIASAVVANTKMAISLITLSIVDNDSLNPIPSLYLPSLLDVSLEFPMKKDRT
eukprot:scaffold17820_cov78-Attheya_sp.AAC.1